MNIELRPLLEDAIKRLRQRLEEARSTHQVDVFTFYTGKDPFLPSFLRCLAAPGAAFEETASHLPLTSLPAAGNFRFVPDARTDSLRDKDGPVAERLIQRDRERNLVFGDFVTREGIQSLAWFVQRDAIDGQPEALLTVNYRSPRNEQDWLHHDKAPLQELFTGLVEQLEPIETLHKGLYALLAWDLIRIINVALPAELGQGSPDRCRASLERILTLAAEALWRILSDAPPGRWSGAVYLLDASKQRLQLTAQAGASSLALHELDVEAGEGVVSWVAIRGQPVCIPDWHRSSRCQAIQGGLVTGVRSQLAVPMIRGGEVMGVLSLESPEPDVFSPTGAGFLTRVASLAATRLDCEQIRQERDQYLEAVYAAKRAQAPVEPLPSFEELLRTSGRR
jgi:putative methionine-R-sulfoxide reductase with GAF domain